MREKEKDQTVSGPRGQFRVHLGVAMAIAVLCLCWSLSPVSGEENTKPLWELGLAGGAGWLPDYPAADENHPVGLVLPYFVYRGKIFRAGDDGIARGRFLKSDRHEFDVSISGSFPTDSNHNDARRGMPNLDFLLELGPRLKLTLIDLDQHGQIGVELPVRLVFSINLDKFAFRGLVVHPKLVYRHRNLFDTGIGLKISSGPIFATEKLMDYFYQVDSQFVAPNRSAFEADAGYLGTTFTILLSKQVTRRVDIFAAMRVGYFGGASNDDSPLFRRNVNVGIGLGFTWSMFQSKQRVTE